MRRAASGEDTTSFVAEAEAALKTELRSLGSLGSRFLPDPLRPVLPVPAPVRSGDPALRFSLLASRLGGLGLGAVLDISEEEGKGKGAGDDTCSLTGTGEDDAALPLSLGWNTR